MKRITKLMSIVLSALILVFCFAGCGSSGSGTKKITSESQAISAVKSYMSGTSFSLEQEIAGALGFKKFTSPDYGTSSATQNPDGSWSVTIKGSMLGYVDEYSTDLKDYKFEVNADISSTGSIYISARKAY